MTSEDLTETEAIPYETVRENDPTLEEGKEVV
ncbi:G5 domain-containing protein, partial [Streptococcus suis]